MDNVHKPHNVSAVVRTCDAVGVLEAHAVAPGQDTFVPRHESASGVRKYIRVRTHPSHGAAFDALRDRGFRIYAAHLDENSRDFRSVDFTRPTAFLLGAELDGVSDDALAGADGAVFIPMLGAVASLNVSVAAAILLFEAQRQRQAAGLYDTRRLDADTYTRTLFEWAYPEIAELCRRRGQPYPPLDDEGELLGDVPRG